MRTTSWRRVAARCGALACAAILGSCGQGGGSNSSSAPVPPPPKAAGEIDTTFGEGGIRRLSFSNQASDARVDALGRVLLASYSSFVVGAPTQAYFTRVLPDGNWDQSLIKSIPVSAGESYRSDARVFPVATGGFVALSATTSLAGIGTLVAQKFDDAGNADATYGSAGSATLSVDAFDDFAGAPDGSVVIFGTTGPPIPPVGFDLVTFSTAVWRLDARGQRDTTFEKNAGVALAGCGPTAREYHAGRRSDGRIAMALKIASGDWCVAQLNPDGTADATFGTAGHTELSMQLGSFSAPNIVLPLPGGGVAVVVNSVAPVHEAFTNTVIFWLTASGQIDATRGGLRTYEIPAFPIGRTTSAAVQSDGKVLLMGVPYVPASPFIQADPTQPHLVRLDLQGNLDPAFGPGKNGFVTLDTGGNRLSPGRAIASGSGVVYPSGGAAPSGAFSDTGYLAVSVMKVYTGEP